MSIDADLSAGLIDESEARTCRKQLVSEAEFYGAMDGASRFTQRDAVASILITTINIVAGLLIGLFQHNMDFGRAVSTYSVLTIGDGLVTVIPSLMVSICGGLIVTRTSSGSTLSADVNRQVFSNPEPLMLTGGALIALAAFPGLPTLPFLALGSGVGFAGWKMRQKLAAAEKVSLQTAASTFAAPPAKESIESLLKLEAVLKVNPLVIEVGLGLVKLVEDGESSPLLSRIAGIRRQIANELGYLVPPVHVVDNLQLKAREYAVLLKGAEMARFELVQNCELAVHPAGAAEPLAGPVTREPAFGMEAVWISAGATENARGKGYTVVDPVNIVGAHLAELIRRYAYELLSHQDVKNILDRVGREDPKLVEDLVLGLLSMTIVQKVLQNLLRERVSMRDPMTIVEALGEAAVTTRNPVLLTESVRQATRRLLIKPYLNAAGELPAYFVDPQIEHALEFAIENGEHASHLNLTPPKIHEIVDSVTRGVVSAESATAVVTSSAVRFFLRRIIEGTIPNVAVLSHNEIPPGVRVVSLGLIQTCLISSGPIHSAETAA